MKSNSRKIIKAIKVCLDVIWYGAIIIAVISTLPLLYELLFNQYAEWIAQVRVSDHQLVSHLKLTEAVRLEKFWPEEANLSFRIKNSAFIKFSNTFITFGSIALILAIIQQIRNFFIGLNTGRIFTIENIFALKKAALFVVLIFPVQAILYLFERHLVNTNFRDIHSIEVVPVFNMYSVIIAIILYIVAEIFNYGLELKKENEEFV